MEIDIYQYIKPEKIAYLPIETVEREVQPVGSIKKHTNEYYQNHRLQCKMPVYTILMATMKRLKSSKA